MSARRGVGVTGAVLVGVTLLVAVIRGGLASDVVDSVTDRVLDAPATTTTIYDGDGPSPLTPPSTVAPHPDPAPMPAGDDVEVTKVSDGDTIRVQYDDPPRRGSTNPVRLIGVDTPESVKPNTPVQCYAKEAAAYLGSLIPVGTPVRLVYDVQRTDRYGRTLAYVYRLSDGLFVNLALARGGYANVLTIPPDVAHAGEFKAAVAEARAANRGLWGAC